MSCVLQLRTSCAFKHQELGAVRQLAEEDDAMGSMSPSSMLQTLTSGQIGKFEELFGEGLRKAGLPSDPGQQVIENQARELVVELVASVRKRVEALSDIIVRRVKVDRKLTPQRLLDATGRKQYTDRSAVKSMPRGKGEETDVYFFKLGRYVFASELDKEYVFRGLASADPYSQSRVNTDDPSFADTHPNGTSWKDANGRWCSAVFDRWGGERSVRVRRGDGWDVYWWFAGVRKPSTTL